MPDFPNDKAKTKDVPVSASGTPKNEPGSSTKEFRDPKADTAEKASAERAESKPNPVQNPVPTTEQPTHVARPTTGTVWETGMTASDSRADHAVDNPRVGTAAVESTVMTREEKAAHEAKMGKTQADLEREARMPRTFDARNPRGAPGTHVEQGVFNENKAPQTQDTEWAQALNRHYAFGEPMPTKAHCYCGKDGICVGCNCCEQHCGCGTTARWVEGGYDTMATTNVFSTKDMSAGLGADARASRRGAANYESGKENARGEVVDDAYGASGDVTPKS